METVKAKPYNLRNINKTCQVRIRASDIVAVYENLQLKRKLKRIEEAKDKTKEKYPCQICGRIYAHRRNMNAHKIFECGTKPRFVCDICGHRTKRKASLLVHIRNLHSKRGQYIEDEKDQINEPERIHKCNECGRSYAYLNSLNSHKRYECGVERKFKCSFCGRKFKRKIHMKNHIDKHHLKTSKFDENKTHPRNESARKYKCNKCERSYSLRITLFKHKKYACDAKGKFVCDFCGHESKRKDNLRIHIRNIHSKNQ